MKQYLDLVRQVLEHGEKKTDRTGTGTLSLFGLQAKYNLREGFPLVTTKKVLFDGILRELLWFLKGSTNINDGLKAHTPIWNAWANESGELGPIYGYQWRHWPKYVEGAASAPGGPAEQGAASEPGFRKEGIDQIRIALDTIRKNPDSRRIIVSAWNVSDLDKMALPPCHAFFQFYVAGGRLDMQMYQRSADMALGVPFNIASYALLLMMFAQETGLTPGVFTHTLGDAHLYLNHLDGIRLQLQRQPHSLPQVTIAKKPLFDLRFEDFSLQNYVHDPFIKFPVAV